MLEHGHGKLEIAERLAQQKRQSYLRDVVYGAIDGTVTTFAIVAGVQGAGLPASIIITLGIANIFADGFSMAASNFSGTKAEMDDRKRLRQIEERHVREVPSGEREELRQILAAKGMHGNILDGAVAQVSANRDKWIETMLAEEYGLSTTFLKPLHAAIATFVAFCLTGIVPLLPYIIGVADAFQAAAIATGCVFFGIGAAKSKWSLAPWWVSALETLAIGTAAALIAYVVGRFFHP